jgi:ATP-dependent Clp protease ATP-binding subunit ClpX
MEPSPAEIRVGCLFCRKPDSQVELLLAGPDGVYICGACVESCNRIIAGRRAKAPSPGRAPVPGSDPRGPGAS